METHGYAARQVAHDHSALHAAAEAGAGLCTIVSIDGSFSRRLGAQLAVHGDGQVTGSLADGCLERQLATEIRSGGERRVMRFGAGSPLIDFRLPCGSGLDILVEPVPDRDACRTALSRLEARQGAALDLPVPKARGLLERRLYMPALGLQLFGEGPELETLATLGRATGLAVEVYAKDDAALSLGQRPQGLSADRWTAIVLLFHDHEWEQAILQWAIETPAFYIGAQGGRQAREERTLRLSAAGLGKEAIDRVRSPVGIVKHSREPAALALSALAQIVGEYESLHPHTAREFMRESVEA
jgi:xanthine dehydrogenase accessory factor